MNFLPGKKYGVPSHNFVKKMFCAKKVTKLPDLTVVYWGGSTKWASRGYVPGQLRVSNDGPGLFYLALCVYPARAITTHFLLPTEVFPWVKTSE